MDNFTNSENNTQNTTQPNGTYSTDYMNNSTAQSTVSQENTYAQNDAYAQNNAYAQSGVYTQPNTYTGATAAWQQQQQQQQQQYNNVNAYNTNMYNYNAAPQNKEKIAFAIISLVCGILSIVCCCWIGLFNLIFAIPSIVLGIIAIKKKYAGKGMAIAGIICSAVGILLGIVLLVFMLAGLASQGYSYNVDYSDLFDSSYYY